MTPPRDPWAARARPTFLYAMSALLLWAIPLSLVAAFRPVAALAMARALGPEVVLMDLRMQDDLHVPAREMLRRRRLAI